VPPIITITGRSNTGKTTLVEKLVRELTARGYLIATVKDSHKQPTFDGEGTDSQRHTAAGSTATAIRTQHQVVVMHNYNRELELGEIAKLIGDKTDLIIAEGFKHDKLPKIEVHRKGQDLLDNPPNLIAYATEEHLDTPLPQYDINDFSGICDYLIENFIPPKRQRVALYINNKEISLKEFPADIIENVTTNMVQSLKETENIESIEIIINKACPPQSNH